MMLPSEAALTETTHTSHPRAADPGSVSVAWRMLCHMVAVRVWLHGMAVVRLHTVVYNNHGCRPTTIRCQPGAFMRPGLSAPSGPGANVQRRHAASQRALAKRLAHGEQRPRSVL